MTKRILAASCLFLLVLALAVPFGPVSRLIASRKGDARSATPSLLSAPAPRRIASDREGPSWGARHTPDVTSDAKTVQGHTPVVLPDAPPSVPSAQGPLVGAREGRSPSLPQPIAGEPAAEDGSAAPNAAPPSWENDPAISVPETTQEAPSQVGLRAHTNHLIHLHPAVGLGPGGGMTPAQMRSFYGMPSSGGGGVIAIVDAFDYPAALSDFNAFAAQFGLPRETSANVTSSSNAVFQVVYQGGTRPQANVGWEQEEALDIEWAHAMAPSAKIVLVEAQSDSFSNLLAAVDVAASISGVREISMSWGGSEWSGESYYDSHFNRSGPFFFASSGDYGGVTNWPSTSPYVVAVGGTHVSTNSSGAFTGETGWTDGGGGNSPYESKPSWQVNVRNTGSNRSVPDIACDADPYSGASIHGPYSSGGGSGWQVFGGTSLSSPCMAGMANVRGASYASTSALLTYVYGRLGTSSLRDITSGNNGFPCLVGWDFVTGVGSPQGTLFGAGGGGSAPAITSPTPGSTLSGSTVTFSWSAGGGVSQYWLQVGTTAGGTNLFNQNEGTNLSATVTGLPTDGSTVYVRLWYYTSGTWLYLDVTYTAYTKVTPPAITSPTPGSTLSGATVTFSWSAGTGVTQYWLYVGTTAGGSDLFNQNEGMNLSAAVTGLPTNGSTVYVRLWYYTNGWLYIDVTYTAASSGGGGGVPAMTSPAPGSTLSGANVTFTWTAGSGVQDFWLYVGSAQGWSDLFDQEMGLSLSASVTGLPTDGRALYVRLWFYTQGAWWYVDYTYTAY